jgi:hypothetical protein
VLLCGRDMDNDPSRRCSHAQPALPVRPSHVLNLASLTRQYSTTSTSTILVYPPFGVHGVAEQSAPSVSITAQSTTVTGHSTIIVDYVRLMALWPQGSDVLTGSNVCRAARRLRATTG